MKYLFTIVLLAVLLAACSAVDQREQEIRDILDEVESEPARSSSPTTLLNFSGRGDEVSDTFRLSQSCGKVVLRWTAEQIDDGDPFMNFRIYDTSITEYSIERFGTYGFSGSDSGSNGFPLDAGNYYLEVTGHKASWTVKVTCEG